MIQATMLAPGWISDHIRTETHPAERLAEIARRQYGIASRRQLLTAGVSAPQVTRWAREGHIHRLHRGVFSVGHRSLVREAVYLAAALAAGEPAALSHFAAARHRRVIRDHRYGPLQVIVPHRRQPKLPTVHVHRSRTIERIDVAVVRSIPATTPTRTLVDLSPILSASALRDLFERVECLEELQRDRLQALLGRCRGTGALRKLAGYEPLPLSRNRSDLERIVLTTCRTYSLPLPAVNVPLLGYEVDFLWEGAKLVIEADGGHHRGEQRDNDNARDLALQRAGYLVRRYSEEALGRPDAVAREIRELLSERWLSAGSASR